MNKIFISDSINLPKRILFLNKKLCSQLLALFSVGRVRSQNFIKTGAGAGEDTGGSFPPYGHLGVDPDPQ